MASGNNEEPDGGIISYELSALSPDLCYDDTPKQGYALGSIKFLYQDSFDMGYKDRDYIIIDAKSDPSETFEYLTQKWNLEAPRLVISLIGGYRGIKHVTMSVKKTFRRQLVNAVLSTGAWITTGGMHSGMTKDVGEALRDYAIGRAITKQRSIVTLGIVPLSVLKHKDMLKNGQKLVKYKIDPSDVTNAQLDPNHTHFIIVDDEGSANAGVEMDVQGKLLREITGRMIEDSTAGVPVVCIVIGGGYKRIKAVHQAVMSNIPVIILEHTGGTADVLAFACANMKDSTSDRPAMSLQKIDTRFIALLRTEFGTEKIEHVDYGDIAQKCREIAGKSNLVTVISFNELQGPNIVEDTILNALLNVQSGQNFGDQLHLTAVLNRIDLAQKLLKGETNMKVTEVRQTIRFALVHDQVKLVRLFLNKGLSLYEYITVQELTTLYEMINKDTLLYELLELELAKSKPTPEQHPVQRSVTLKDVGHVLRKLTPSCYRPLYLIDDIALVDHSDRFPDPSRELFLWAILQGRLELAELFWREGKASIGGALVASKLLKELANEENALHESRRLTKYEKGGRLFEQLAVGVLEECYRSDRNRTSVTIVRHLEKWGSANCLDLANSASNKKFIAHAAVQNMLKEFWMGKLSLSNPRWKVWVCMIFPPALLCIHLKLKEEEVDPLLVKRLPRGTSHGQILIRKPLKHQATISKPRRWGLSTMWGLPALELRRRRTKEAGKEGGDQKEKDAIRPRVPRIRRIKYFFLVPLVIFLYNVVSIGTFIGLFSYILLTYNFDETPEIQPIEYVLLVWFGTLCMEEIRQIYHEDAKTFWRRLKSWISNFWNIVDVAKSTVFIIGYVLRSINDPNTMSAGRIVLSLALILFYMRVLHIFSSNNHLGPKIIMIQKMFADLVIFIVLLFVFLIAYGVASEAILNPGRTNTSAILESIFYRPYIQMFGEMILEDTDNSECTADCPKNVWYGTILLAIYLFFSNVLLLNLLIAMFNYTFSAVQENTDVYWKYQRYKLIREYYKRPPLAPPFIIICHIYSLVVGSCKKLLVACKKCRDSKYCTCCKTTPDPKEPSQTQASINEMTIWESVKGEDYLSKEQEKENRDINKILKNSDRRILHLTELITKLGEDVSLIQEQMKYIVSEKRGPSEQPTNNDVDPVLNLTPESPQQRWVANTKTSRVPLVKQANYSADISDEDDESVAQWDGKNNV